MVILDSESSDTSIGPQDHKSGDFTYSSSGEEVKNVSANQKRDQPFWIWDCSENVQHLCRIPTRTLVINLAARHAIVYRSWKCEKFNAYRWTNESWTLLDQKSSGELKATNTYHFFTNTYNLHSQLVIRYCFIYITMYGLSRLSSCNILKASFCLIHLILFLINKICINTDLYNQEIESTKLE